MLEPPPSAYILAACVRPLFNQTINYINMFGSTHGKSKAKNKRPTPTDSSLSSELELKATPLSTYNVDAYALTDIVESDATDSIEGKGERSKKQHYSPACSFPMA